MRAPRVVVGYHTFGTVHAGFCMALARAIAYEGNRIDRVIDVMSPYTEDGRNRVVEAFLGGSSAEFLLMVDADIEFERDAISKTMWVAQNTGADVVWGNYALGTFGNSIFTKDAESEWASILTNLKPNMVYSDIYGGGTGWCLMTRKVLLQMQKEHPAPWHWFGRDMVPGPGGKLSMLGEDIGFGRRVSKLKNEKGSRPLQVGYTGLVLIHHKFHSTIPQFMMPVASEYVGQTPLTPVAGVPEQKVAAPPAAPEITPESTEPDGEPNGTDVHSHGSEGLQPRQQAGA